MKTKIKRIAVIFVLLAMGALGAVESMAANKATVKTPYLECQYIHLQVGEKAKSC